MRDTGGSGLAMKVASSSTATGREDANALSTITSGTNIMTGIIAGSTSAGSTVITIAIVNRIHEMRAVFYRPPDSAIVRVISQPRQS
jgi:hypothetical protein